MEVRPATIEDVNALGAGMKAVVDEGGFLATKPPVDALELAARFRGVLTDGDHLLVLCDQREVVGALGLHAQGALGVLALGMWIVAPARGRGGGRMLIEAAFELVRKLDVHKVELEVYPDNGRALALYDAVGFEIEGVRRQHYRQPDGTLRSAVIMARHFGAVQERSS